jgi:hypothetical protein
MCEDLATKKYKSLCVLNVHTLYIGICHVSSITPVKSSKFEHLTKQKLICMLESSYIFSS